VRRYYTQPSVLLKKYLHYCPSGLLNMT
jgi:hypothetical protein